jgi:ElaB/YqjD/DUF883 family membrane-anchored ribosome-binding protein
MGEDPHAIREQIEHTRERMGETMDALSYKADVKSRARNAMSDKMQTVKDKVGGVTERAPSGGDLKRGARRAGGVVQENPLGLAIGSIAVGFLAGMAIPSTRVEAEHLGPVADDVKERVKETGGEALERGKQVVQEAAHTAAETAREAGG